MARLTPTVSNSYVRPSEDPYAHVEKSTMGSPTPYPVFVQTASRRSLMVSDGYSPTRAAGTALPSRSMANLRPSGFPTASLAVAV